jgi:hypothetical protein
MVPTLRMIGSARSIDQELKEDAGDIADRLRARTSGCFPHWNQRWTPTHFEHCEKAIGHGALDTVLPDGEVALLPNEWTNQLGTMSELLPRGGAGDVRVRVSHESSVLVRSLSPDQAKGDLVVKELHWWLPSNSSISPSGLDTNRTVSIVPSLLAVGTRLSGEGVMIASGIWRMMFHV